MAQPADLATAAHATGQRSGAPAWRLAHTPGALPADPALADWLVHEGSLTGRLRALGGDRFRLEVIVEGWERAEAADRRLLGTDNEELYVRRVRMGVANEALVQACTLIPAATVEAHPWLTRLGPVPLWEALAARGGADRTAFEFGIVSSTGCAESAALRGLPPGPEGLWARRSRFLLDGASLAVYEFFLPALTSSGPA